MGAKSLQFKTLPLTPPPTPHPLAPPSLARSGPFPFQPHFGTSTRKNTTRRRRQRRRRLENARSRRAKSSKKEKKSTTRRPPPFLAARNTELQFIPKCLHVDAGFLFVFFPRLGTCRWSSSCFFHHTHKKLGPVGRRVTYRSKSFDMTPTFRLVPEQYFFLRPHVLKPI